MLCLNLYDSTLETRRDGGLWPRHSRLAVSRFQYARDGLFLVACSLYAFNRLVLNPRLNVAFLREHFNDLLLIPCALPLLLLFQRWLGLRRHDLMPTQGEIAFNVAVWSVLFELIGPHLMPWTVGDPWDAVAYAIGGLLSGLWWQRRRPCAVSPHEL